jgi:competence protein ComEA
MSLRLRPILSCFLFTLFPAQGADTPFTKMENCQYSKTEWADGDSFPIVDASGKEMTVRLYGVDCIETQSSEDSDARRLLQQQRYFGIHELGRDFAIARGRDATIFTAAALQKPFTVHTTFADARGDARFKRVYAFVTTAKGEDLGALLIKAGLARAFGVYRSTPDGVSHEELRQRMSDLELQALRRGVGIWAKTNWDKLPEERRQLRKELADLDEAKGNLPSTTNSGKIDINKASRAELMSIKGIGEITANNIIGARPYKKIDDLRNVPGIGEKSYLKLSVSLEVR